MADEAPYKVVIEALAAQTAAIGKLAHEIQEEFKQYQNATKSKDTARANAIAAAINQRTAKLVEAAESLEASVPDAEVGGGPAEPPSTPDQGLPGDQPGIDNTLPGRDRPVDPGFGVGSERPSTGPIRPGTPTDPDFGVDAPGRPVAPDQPPGGIDRPGQDLPGVDRPSTGPVRPGTPTDPDFGVDAPGRPTAPDQPPGGGDRPVAPDQPPSGVNRPDQGLPPAGSEGTPPERPQPKPELDYIAPATAKVGEDTFFDVHGDGFTVDSVVSVDGEAVEKTTHVNTNLVRFHKTFGSAGTSKVTVNNSDPLDVTVS